MRSIATLHPLNVIPPLFDLHFLRPFVVMFLQYFPTNVHPVADDIHWHVLGQVVGDTTSPDRVRTHRVTASPVLTLGTVCSIEPADSERIASL